MRLTAFLAMTLIATAAHAAEPPASRLTLEAITGDDYTIADMAAYPWINPYDKAPLDLAPFAEVRRWHAAIAARPATQRAYALGKQVSGAGQPLSDEERKILFGHGARPGTR